MRLRQRLTRLLQSDTELEARNGEYRNVFCPHCGSFIPERYTVAHESVMIEAMKFHCPNCGESGAVMESGPESKIDWTNAKIDADDIDWIDNDA